MVRVLRMTSAIRSGEHLRLLGRDGRDAHDKLGHDSTEGLNTYIVPP
jgi:hypothetical protein